MGKYDLTNATPYNEHPLYKKGYEDALDDFCEWLKTNYGHFDGKVEDFVADFRKAMTL